MSSKIPNNLGVLGWAEHDKGPPVPGCGLPVNMPDQGMNLIGHIILEGQMHLRLVLPEPVAAGVGRDDRGHVGNPWESVFNWHIMPAQTSALRQLKML
jgi:hypothetical protein